MSSIQRDTSIPSVSALQHLGQGIVHDARLPFGSSFVDRFILSNGLRVLIVEDHAAPIVAIYTGVGVGSRHERAGKTGIAHLMEHLMFGKAFEAAVDACGGHNNAFTWYDHTCFQTEVPSHAAMEALQLEADRMRELRITKDDFDREMEIVQHERKQRVEDEPVGFAMEESLATLFSDHAYGRPIIGAMTDIQGLSINNMLQFFDQYYRPNNMVLSIVGDVDTVQIMRHVNDCFGSIEPKEIPVELVEPEFQFGRERTLTMKLDIPPRIWVGYLVPSAGDRLDHVAMILLDQILFGGRTGRMYRRTVSSGEPIATTVSAQLISLAHHGAYWMTLSAYEGKSLDEVLVAVDECIRAIKQEPVSQDEIDMARAQFEVGGYGALERNGYRAQTIGDGELSFGNPTILLDDLSASRHVRAGDIMRVARRFLHAPSRVVVRIERGQK